MKHIALRQCPPTLPSSSAPLLPNLTSVLLSRSGCNADASWILSEHLQEIQVIIGTMHESNLTRERATHLARLLQQWRESYPNSQLLKLYIRGWLSPALTRAIAPLTSLRSLSLLYGSSITPQLLRAISLFPFLEELNVHVDCVSVDDFNLVTPPPNAIAFPRLRSLLISGTQPLITAVLELLQSDILEDLTIEVNSPILYASYWTPVLDMIVTKAYKSLRQLELLHSIPIDSTPSLRLPTYSRSETAFTLESLRSLSVVHGLRSVILDTTIPPELTDRDIEEMAAWWPHIERLDLGTLPYPDQELMHNWQPKTTVAALSSLAQRCPHLQSLTIPLDFSVVPDAPKSKEAAPITQQVLRTLTVGHHALAEPLSTFIQKVLDIFPSLRLMECDSGRDKQDVYVRNSATSEGILVAGDKNRSAGTEDELANGH